MHKTFVFHVVARLIVFVSIWMLAPLGWALAEDPHSRECAAFIVTILIGLGAGAFILWRFPLHRFDVSRVTAKDGLAVVGLSWVVLSALGALPLWLSEATTSFTDAYFEIASGFTTTGASIFTDVEVLPHGILFWRSLTHWLGGMGIIVLYVALLPALGHNAYQLYKAEAPGLVVERIQPQIKETAKWLWGVYFGMSVLEAVLLKIAGMSWFESLCHTFGTMATGGFSTRNASIGAYSATIQWIIIVFMFLAGTNFILHVTALQGRWRAYARNEEFRWYTALILIAAGLTALGLAVGQHESSPIRHALFQTLTILTTTGYSTVDFGAWPALGQYALLILMFIGGCGGSTGGGMKVIRALICCKAALRSVMQNLFPNAVLLIKFEGKVVDNRLVMAALGYFVLYVMLFVAGAAMLLFIEPCDLITAISASVAALSNIGPGLGAVGPTLNYAWMSPAGKWVLVFLMLAGRLELYSILVLLVPAAWRK